jgi:hypothetical protein
MTILTIEDKIKIIQEKILEEERVIRYVRNPSQEEIDAQVLTGTKDKLDNQVLEQTKVIDLLNSILDDLKSGIDTYS